MASIPKSKKSLTVQERVRALTLSDLGWSSVSIAKRLDVGKTQIQRVIRDKELRLERWKTEAEARLRQSKAIHHHEVNEEMWTWFHDIRERIVRITRQLMKDRARRVATGLGYQRFMASDSWLDGWLRSYNVRTDFSSSRVSESEPDNDQDRTIRRLLDPFQGCKHVKVAPSEKTLPRNEEANIGDERMPEKHNETRIEGESMAEKDSETERRIKGESMPEKHSETRIEGESMAEKDSETMIEGESMPEKHSETRIEGESMAEKHSETMIEGESMAEKDSETMIERESMAEKHSETESEGEEEEASEFQAWKDRNPKGKQSFYLHLDNRCVDYWISIGQWEKLSTDGEIAKFLISTYIKGQSQTEEKAQVSTVRVPLQHFKTKGSTTTPQRLKFLCSRCRSPLQMVCDKCQHIQGGTPDKKKDSTLIMLQSQPHLEASPAKHVKAQSYTHGYNSSSQMLLEKVAPPQPPEPELPRVPCEECGPAQGSLGHSCDAQPVEVKIEKGSEWSDLPGRRVQHEPDGGGMPGEPETQAEPTVYFDRDESDVTAAWPWTASNAQVKEEPMEEFEREPLAESERLGTTEENPQPGNVKTLLKAALLAKRKRPAEHQLSRESSMEVIVNPLQKTESDEKEGTKYELLAVNRL
ncbi:uncharacterized protein [Littorina saxatilis]|uniref:HTH CENPB-type domain-containing protein n=1 Tax=Littorina saxatilis TaxID=31220 RepID=A0AAN9AY58_9CAEN